MAGSFVIEKGSSGTRKTTKDGSPYFTLTATNGQVIGASEAYSSTSAMENGIASVKMNAPNATVIDRS